MPDEDLSISVDAFVRSIGVNRSTPHALFLGAAASISSGIPSAAMCIWEWKRAIFLTNNPGLEAQFGELSLPSVRSNIQRWLDQQHKYPTAGDAEEYGTYIQQCYPIADDRRAYFQEKVRRAVPHVGYRLLGELGQAGFIQSVWTINFDGLTAKAASMSRVVPIEVGIDCQTRLPRRPNRTELLCVSLHGDYRYDALRNTPLELQEQEQKLRKALIDSVTNIPLVVLGYSGRDASIMETLETGYRANGTGTLYWCGFSDGAIPDHIRRLIELVRGHGKTAYYVPGVAFDNVMLRLALHCLQGEGAQSPEVQRLIATQETSPSNVRVDFRLPELPPCGIIKGNIFEFTPPGEVYEFDLQAWPDKGVWKYFDDCTTSRQIVAAPFKSKGYAFGTIDDLRLAFAPNIKEHINRVPINDVDLRYEDGVIVSLVRRALVQAMAVKGNVNSDGRNLLWQSTSKTRLESGVQYLIKDALLVYIRRIARQMYVALKPTIRIERADGSVVPEEVERTMKTAILGWQHNAEFNQAVEAWRKKLFSTDPTDFEFPNNCGSPFRFRVRRTPILAKISASKRTGRITIPQKFEHDIKQSGVELIEPRLVFSNLSGTGTTLA